MDYNKNVPAHTSNVCELCRIFNKFLCLACNVRMKTQCHLPDKHTFTPGNLLFSMLMHLGFYSSYYVVRSSVTLEIQEWVWMQFMHFNLTNFTNIIYLNYFGMVTDCEVQRKRMSLILISLSVWIWHSKVDSTEISQRFCCAIKKNPRTVLKLQADFYSKNNFWRYILTFFCWGQFYVTGYSSKWNKHQIATKYEECKQVICIYPLAFYVCIWTIQWIFFPHVAEYMVSIQFFHFSYALSSVAANAPLYYHVTL